MCRKPIGSKETNAKRKCFVVLFTVGREAKEVFGNETAMDFSPLKIFASNLMAKVYCEHRAREFQSKDKTTIIDWKNADTLLLYKREGEKQAGVDFRWEIYETEIDDHVPADFHYPQIETENEVLRNECCRLRKELADVIQRNAVAATYATMWDGGRDYTKEHVLQNLHIVKDVLAGDHAKVQELYEAWKKSEGGGVNETDSRVHQGSSILERSNIWYCQNSWNNKCVFFQE